MQSISNRKRILVIGSGGAGKTTFARVLGTRLGLPVTHLDRHYWKPGWQATPSDEWNRIVAGLAGQHEWIIDGNYGGSLPLRLSRCDAVVFFDFPRLQCLWGVVKRRFATGRRTRPDMGEGCPERLTLEFIFWIWNYPRGSRRRIINALHTLNQDVALVMVRNRRDVHDVLLACGIAPT
jgi:adenylate kinase family enzyme